MPKNKGCKIITEKKKIEEVLTRGVEKIYPSRDALEEVLKSGKKMRIYNGIDPTGKLHIGHVVVLGKLKQFQDLGHEIIVLIGDFTARIGDPTGKLSTRRQLTKKEVEMNAASFKKLISKILDTSKSNIRFLHNEEWTNKLKPEDVLELASCFTVQKFLERDMFRKRMKAGKEIYLHEFLYPLFQAYDSVTMDVDMEVGGNDQTFNMLAGRTLMRKKLKKEKFVLTTKLLEDPTGAKMSTTGTSMINLDDSPRDMYGKIMAQPDGLILPYFELVSDLTMDEVGKIKKRLGFDKTQPLRKSGDNPRDVKAELAREIVKMFYGAGEAKRAGEEFDRVFRDKEKPDDIAECRLQIADSKITIIELLVKTKMVSSKSEGRRMVEQGGVKIDGKKVDDVKREIKVKEGMVISVGKRRFVRIKMS